jgi:general stress protein 26
MRIKRYKNNPMACIYFYDMRFFLGVMLKGKMEVLDDRETKREIWKDEFSKYYTGGCDGGEFILIRVTAESGRYYRDFSVDFKIEY